MRRAIRNEADLQLWNFGEVVRIDAQESIRAGAISGPGHIPSLPGEPPNADTHNLDMSIDTRISPTRKSVIVFARARYAAALEMGTSKIEPRPYLRPALQRNRNRLVSGMVQAVQDTVRVYKSDSAFNRQRENFEAGND